jgi:hypothetical protein
VVEDVVSQALSWGFVCDHDQLGNRQIFPLQATERWELREDGERWLLLVGGVPQVLLHAPETISFLERRRLILEEAKDVDS